MAQPAERRQFAQPEIYRFHGESDEVRDVDHIGTKGDRIQSSKSDDLSDADRARLEELNRKIEELAEKLKNVWSRWGEQGAETVKDLKDELNRTISERSVLIQRVKNLEIDLKEAETLRKLLNQELREKNALLDSSSAKLATEEGRIKELADRVDTLFNRLRDGAVGGAIAAAINVYAGLSPEVAALLFVFGLFGTPLAGDRIRWWNKP